MSAGQKSSAPVRAARRRPRPSATLARVEQFLREIRPDAPEPTAQYVRELMASAIRLLEDGTPIADIRLLNAAVRELRYAFRIIGMSARESMEDPTRAELFGIKRI